MDLLDFRLSDGKGLTRLKKSVWKIDPNTRISF